MSIEPGWMIRPPTMDDVPDILAVVHASDIAAVGEPDFTTDGVVEALTGCDPRYDSWVALDPYGQIQGWAFLDNPTRSAREDFEVYVHPELGLPALATLFGLALARIPVRARDFGHPQVRVRAGIIASETAYVDLLVAAGFTFIKRYARMVRALTGAERTPEPLPAVTIRPVRPDELPTFYAILKRAFDDLPDPMPGDYDDFHATFVAVDGVAWDEWLVAEVDGVLVGALQSSDHSAEKNEGWVRKVGVAAEFRGRSLGRQLLRTAFAVYAGKGRTAVGLGVDLTNPTGAYRVYEGVGMHPLYEADIYERDLPAAPS